MRVVLFRHGHKDFNPFEDPFLSPRGFEQASRLAEEVANHKIPTPTHCWYSPKIRTFQTFEKVISLTKCKNEKILDLNVRSHEENSTQFRSRVQRFLNILDTKSTSAEHQNEVHYICTHYDWIEEAMTIIQCDKNLYSFEYASWAPAQFLVFEIHDQTWHLIQKGVLT